MADTVDSETRSRMMSAIRGKNTSPEIAVRRYLHARGFRFRLHRKDLPGKPDIVLPKHHLAIFVHGCFWHRHPGCFYSTLPSSRRAFWEEKFQRNVERDERNKQALIESGWRTMIIWECGIKCCMDDIHAVCDLILSDELFSEWPPFPCRRR